MSLEKVALHVLSKQVPHIRHGEFNKSIVRQLRTWGETESVEDVLAELQACQSRPDAFSFCDYCQCIHVYEIEDTCRLDIERLDRYIKIFFALDFIEIGFVLWIVDRYGQIVRPLNLMEIMDGMIKAEGLS